MPRDLSRGIFLWSAPGRAKRRRRFGLITTPFSCWEGSGMRVYVIDESLRRFALDEFGIELI